MATYQTGTTTSPTDFLSKLTTFAQSNGWTVLANSTDGTGRRVHLLRDGLYVNLRSYATESVTGQTRTGLWFNTSTSYSASSAWNAQAGGPLQYSDGYSEPMRCAAVCLVRVASMPYMITCDAAGNVVAVIERAPGAYAYLGWGRMPTLNGATADFFYADCIDTEAPPAVGSTTPGATKPWRCHGGTTASAFVRARVNLAHEWLSNIDTIGYRSNVGGTMIYSANYTGRRMAASTGAAPAVQLPCYTNLREATVSAPSSQLHLLPIHIYADLDGAWGLLGTIPGLFDIRDTAPGYPVGSRYQLGTDHYRVFPGFAVKIYP